MMNIIAQYCHYFPSIPLPSSAEKEIKKLHLRIEYGQFIGFSLIVSILLSLIFLISSIGYGLISFCVFFAFFLYLPKAEISKKDTLIRTELPIFLRNLGLFLDLNIPFLTAMDFASDGDGLLFKEIKFAIKEIKNGSSLQNALGNIAINSNSLELKRGISQIITSYLIGGGGMELRRLSEEFLSLERHKLKEHASKSAMFGLVFIMSSAILPTFFLIYATFGKFAWNVIISDIQIGFVLLIIFPLISSMILLIMKLSLPSSGGGIEKNTFIAPLIFILGVFVGEPLTYLFYLIGIGYAAYSAYINYQKENRTEKIETALPDALFSISSLPKAVRAERIFEIIENGNHGPLSEEAAKTKRQILGNLNMESALNDLANRNNSTLLSNASKMIGQMFATGNMDKISLLAEDILIGSQLKREKSQIFSMQKYTLLFGSFLVPLILKITISLLGVMKDMFPNNEEVGSVFIVPYLIIYSIICSTAIADFEGKKSGSGIYLAIMSIVSLLTFYFAKVL